MHSTSHLEFHGHIEIPKYRLHVVCREAIIEHQTLALRSQNEHALAFDYELLFEVEVPPFKCHQATLHILLRGASLAPLSDRFVHLWGAPSPFP